MANDLRFNPWRIDTAAAGIVTPAKYPGGIYVMNMHWCDDGGAAGGVLTANDDMELLINGVSVSVNCVTVWPEVWKTAFSVPFHITQFTVTKIDGGTLYLWLTGKPPAIK